MKKFVTYFMVIALLGCVLFPANAQKKKNQKLRVVYWNIQNGMWDGQRDNYDRFVSWVKTQEPDICIWCEGASYLLTETGELSPKDQRYLPGGWPELAARYGHDHVFVGGMRDPFPQVVTSKYPIDSVGRFIGSAPDSVVVHGAGWAKVAVHGKEINIVTLHLQPYRYWRYLPDDQKEESEKNHGGERYRKMELEWIFNHTVKTHENPEKELWIMAGDFNSRSRKDNFQYKWSLSNPNFMVQKYIEEETPYFYDVVAENYPEIFCPSHSGKSRIDYMFVTKALLKSIRSVDAEPDSYTKATPSGVKKYYSPSDHYPIIVEFNLSKIK